MYWGEVTVEFNTEGLLEPGFHEIDRKKFKDIFVSAFTTSQTRQTIYDSFVQWEKKLISQYKIYEIWIDGSFSTSKVNPNDMDIVVFVHAVDYNKLAHDWENFRNVSNIDAYLTLAICNESENDVTDKEVYWQFVNERNYWRGQFGFDRNDSPKGIIVLKYAQKNVTMQGGDIQ